MGKRMSGENRAKLAGKSGSKKGFRSGGVHARTSSRTWGYWEGWPGLGKSQLVQPDVLEAGSRFPQRKHPVSPSPERKYISYTFYLQDVFTYKEGRGKWKQTEMKMSCVLSGNAKV